MLRQFIFFLGSWLFAGSALSASSLVSLNDHTLPDLKRVLLLCGETSGIGTLKRQKLDRILRECQAPEAAALGAGQFTIGLMARQQAEVRYGQDQANYLHINAAAKEEAWFSWNLDGSVGLGSDSHFAPQNILASFGTDVMQVDLGWREHWYATSYQSSFLLSNQAESLPSITLSNNEPLKNWYGLEYEVFLSRQSYATPISYNGSVTDGYPYLAGTALSFTPAKGVSFALYRVFQFGGGDRKVAPLDFVEAFVNPRKADNSFTGEEFGNQTAGFASAMNFDLGAHSVTFHASFSGEDTEGKGYRLGNNALTGGLSWLMPGKYQPMLEFDHAEWHSSWYTHHIYQEGLQINSHSIGHWFTEYAPAGVSGQANSLVFSSRVERHGIELGVKSLQMIDTSAPAWIGQMGYRYRLKSFSMGVELMKPWGELTPKMDESVAVSAGINWWFE